MNRQKTRHSLFDRSADGLLLTGELLAKQVYWNMPWARKMIKRLRSASRKPQVVQRAELRDRLREIGVREGALVMAHTSVTNLRLEEPGTAASRGGFLATANHLITDLLELLGATGTLVMPTNPPYQTGDSLRKAAEREIPISYDPKRTPCEVGLANELFRRRPKVIRSLHPHNTLAARGPLADMLMENNLNDAEPLPHGIHSGYARFCRRNGLIVGIGVPLPKYMTILHVPEDVRDADWPIKDFFERRRYLIRIGDREELHVVRQRRPEFGMFCSIRKAYLDLVREGIVHQSKVRGLTVDWASAGDVFDYMMTKNEKTYYPYFGVEFLKLWSR